MTHPNDCSTIWPLLDFKGEGWVYLGETTGKSQGDTYHLWFNTITRYCWAVQEGYTGGYHSHYDDEDYRAPRWCLSDWPGIYRDLRNRASLLL